MNQFPSRVVHKDGSATVPLFGAEIHVTPEFLRYALIVRKGFRSFAVNSRDDAPTYRIVARERYQDTLLCRRMA